ncbi:MAG: prolyl oligopeptidase family serine peptidase [Planctomycetes bacterium]|nr:prolyl oligopeptidase family serine peptidase [Planctomycetota bacterium]
MRVLCTVATVLLAACAASTASGQTYGSLDQGEPGDKMIQEYLARETHKVHGEFPQDVKSLADWQKARPEWHAEYLYMLGLWPPPPKTPMYPTLTGTLRGEGFVVDLLHYQSRPGLYVTGNLYRPADAKEGERLPAVLYVCGHSAMGRNGNKTAYQSHGIWFARHGYVCLVLDSLQLGEIAGIHHGTYRENRWWWHSRGYTPAGVECLNGLRGIDYLAGRADVDPDRIAVTGISGGGAATFWIAAADDRVKAAVPVSGMADLESYLPNRVINGHCDCMFLYNTFQWPWARIPALVAPRPLLFTNSDKDGIFPMDANERVIAALERVYSLHGAGDRVDACVSVGGHAYREDLRQSAYRFINTYLKDDPRPVLDSEASLVTGEGDQRQYPIAPERLRVFPADTDVPADQLNKTVDEHFVPQAQVEPPAKGAFEPWKQTLVAELRRVTFRSFPERIPAARLLEQADADTARLETEPGIEVRLRRLATPADAKDPTRVLLVVQGSDAADGIPDWVQALREPGDAVYLLAPRGVGPTRWTQKNPPNYVERCHVLLGRTVDTGRVWDVAAAARYLHAGAGGKTPVHVLGQGGAGVLAAYAALWEPEVAAVALNNPPRGHMSADAPPLLNVLRVCDIPDVLGMLAPRLLTVWGGHSVATDKVAKIYAAAGAAEKFVRQPATP